MLLDMYTYGTYCMLANDEWDWRAFARHFYTIIKEHPKTVNSQLNDIVRILRKEIEEKDRLLMRDSKRARGARHLGTPLPSFIPLLEG